jgi:hypothetical protein
MNTIEIKKKKCILYICLAIVLKNIFLLEIYKKTMFLNIFLFLISTNQSQFNYLFMGLNNDLSLFQKSK